MRVFTHARMNPRGRPSGTVTNSTLMAGTIHPLNHSKIHKIQYFRSQTENPTSRGQQPQKRDASLNRDVLSTAGHVGR